MVRIQWTDFIADTELVRAQATNVIPDDFPNTSIQEFQYQAYSLIGAVLNKHDWQPTDEETGAIQRIEIDIADAYIRKHFKSDYDTQTQSDNTIKACMAELQVIKDNLDTATGAEELSIARTAHKSWNLNPDVPVPRGQLVIT